MSCVWERPDVQVHACSYDVSRFALKNDGGTEGGGGFGMKQTVRVRERARERQRNKKKLTSGAYIYD